MEEKNISSEEVSREGKGLLEKGKYDLCLENLLKAGVYFGHKKSRWNPKMAGYIFGIKNGVHIINLEKTLELFRRALDFMAETIEKGGEVMLIGTKNQVKALVKAVGEKAEIPFVNERWIGGTLTNFENISRRVKYLIETEEKISQGKLPYLTKFEKNQLQKELNKLEEKMGGLKNMKRLPKAIFVLDVEKDILAIREAKKRGLPVIGLVDTNSNPEKVDYPIPANDDAYSSLGYILAVILFHLLPDKRAIEKTEEKNNSKII